MKQALERIQEAVTIRHKREIIKAYTWRVTSHGVTYFLLKIPHWKTYHRRTRKQEGLLRIEMDCIDSMVKEFKRDLGD